MKVIERQIEIAAPTARVFELFSAFEDFPRWMHNIQEVRRIDGRRTLWTAGASPTTLVRWEAVTTAFERNRRLAWRAAPGGMVAEMEATFAETWRGTTLLRVSLGEDSPTGHGSAGPAGFSGERVGQTLEESLARFKRLVEQEDEEATLVSRRPREEPEEARFTAAALPSARGRRQFPLAKLLAALLAFAAIAIFLGLALRQRQQQQRTQAEETASAPALTASPTTDPSVTEETTDAEVAAEGSTPAETEPGPVETQSEADENANRAAAAPPNATEEDRRTELRANLDDWIAATTARDVDRQMSFYAPVVERYYTRRNFTRDAVRDDKTRLLEQADAIDIRAGEPEITFGADGRTATMRFRKQYDVKGDRNNRGEVLQELRWARTDDGWKIMSERDVRVIR
ncbi:MAG: SRPBCC family protein [Pyrinomonadaceae bacterium]